MRLVIPSRALTAGAGALVLVAVSAGGVAAGTDTTEPPEDSDAAASTPGCPEITAALQALDEFGAAFLANDLDSMTAVLGSAEDLAAAAQAAAPPEIADAVATWVAPIPGLVALLENVDLTDIEAVTAAMSELPSDPASGAAQAEVITWAEENCGYEAMSFEDQFADAPEPPVCETLDAAAAADAAGVDVDVTDLDGSFDLNLPGFATKACSYGNGVLSLATLSFNSLETVQQFYVDNLANIGGVFVDVDLGSLPDSTLVTQVGVGGATGSTVPGSAAPAAEGTPSVTVSVLEATIPFSVTVTGDDVDPASVVAAAEAVFAALPDEAPAPATTEPMASEPMTSEPLTSEAPATTEA